MVSWPSPCIHEIVWLVTKTVYLRNNYYAKLHWFYNYSSEDFKTSEAQVSVWSRYPGHGILTPTLYSWQIVRLVTKTIWKGKYLWNNYFAKLLGFTIAQLRILELQKHKSGWGSRYTCHGILTPTLYSWQTVWLVTKTIWKRQISKEHLLC